MPGSSIDEIGITKGQLQQYVTEKYYGALYRSRTGRFFDSYPTRRSVCDERQSALAKGVIEIHYNGTKYTEATDIADAFHAHYSRLFGGPNVVRQELDFHSLIGLLPSLADDERAGISGPITLQEVKTAISSLKTNKT